MTLVVGLIDAPEIVMRLRQVNEAQLEAHRLLSSTAGARSGAARASRSGRRPAGPADFWVLEQHLPRPQHHDRLERTCFASKRRS